MKITKKTIIEITIIILSSVIVAIFYNIIRTDGIPFIQTDKKDLIVDDSLLFGNNNIVENETIIINNYDTLVDTTIQIDTSNITNIDSVSKIDSTKLLSDTVDYSQILKDSKKSIMNDFSVVTYEQMKKITEAISNKKGDNFIIIDARRPVNYNKGHIISAQNIYPGDEEETIPKLLQLPKSKTIIIYCDGGNCDLSHQVAALLENFGYTNFFVYEGGWEEWEKYNGK
jgi:rhodanese-related sulfurtransferase